MEIKLHKLYYALLDICEIHTYKILFNSNSFRVLDHKKLGIVMVFLFI